MLNNDQIELVKSTVPLLEASGPAITDYFYNRLFTHNPEAQNIFNMSNQASGKQSFAYFRPSRLTLKILIMLSSY